jgi:hypothetical protein
MGFGPKRAEFHPHHLLGSRMKTRQARELGKRIAEAIQAGQSESAYALLAPLLAVRTPFHLLDCIGEAVGDGPLAEANAFFERIAADRTEGGWVVIASASYRQLGRDPQGVFDRCRDFIVLADVWYATVIFGLRVPGPAMVDDFESTLKLLAPWREDANSWVRRTVGSAINLWTRRSEGAPEYAPQAKALLEFIEPMFEEWDKNAVKGVGWALETLGKYYPDLVTDWMVQQVVHRKRHHRALVLRKTCVYLSEEQRARITGDAS